VPPANSARGSALRLDDKISALNRPADSAGLPFKVEEILPFRSDAPLVEISHFFGVSLCRNQVTSAPGANEIIAVPRFRKNRLLKAGFGEVQSPSAELSNDSWQGHSIPTPNRVL